MATGLHPTARQGTGLAAILVISAAYEALALHLPVDFHYFDAESRGLNADLVAFSFNQQETHRKREETLAPSGWDAILTMHQARLG